MAHTLPYPDAGEDAVADPERRATTGTSRLQKLIGIIGVVVVLWVGSDLFDVVTSGGGGPVGPGGMPGDQGPPGNAPPGEPHDPTSFDHG